MTNSKLKISASYRAIFILSIFMVFFVLIAGAATKSKGSGFGMLIWGYTAWLMYKRRVSDIVSFYKGLLWFDVIAAGVALAVLAFSDNDASRYVGYSTVEATLLFAVVISLTYGLYRYFLNFQNNPNDKSDDENTESSIWEQVSEEIRNSKRVDSLWARAFSEADGDNNKANARYINLRFNQIKSENYIKSPTSSFKSSVESKLTELVNQSKINYSSRQISNSINKFFTFSGRASRSEFWWSILIFYLIGILIFKFMNTLLGHFENYWLIYYHGLLTATVSARRMHDIRKNGWYQLIFYCSLLPIVFILPSSFNFNYHWAITLITLIVFLLPMIFLCSRDGDQARNHYGEIPKYTRIIVVDSNFKIKTIILVQLLISVPFFYKIKDDISRYSTESLTVMIVCVIIGALVIGALLGWTLIIIANGPTKRESVQFGADHNDSTR